MPISYYDLFGADGVPGNSVTLLGKVTYVPSIQLELLTVLGWVQHHFGRKEGVAVGELACSIIVTYG